MFIQKYWRALGTLFPATVGPPNRAAKTLTGLESTPYTVESGASNPTRRTAELEKEPR